MSFNVINRQLEDLDGFEDPSMKHQFEELINEVRSIDSGVNINYEARCDYVFVDSNQNIILVRGEMLLIYKPNHDCEVLMDKIPESRMH